MLEIIEISEFQFENILSNNFHVNDDLEQMTENRMIFKLTEGRSVFKFHGSNHSKLYVGNEEKWNFTDYRNRTDNQAVCSMTTRTVNDKGLREVIPYGIYWYKRYYDQSTWRYINTEGFAIKRINLRELKEQLLCFLTLFFGNIRVQRGFRVQRVKRVFS